MDAAVAGGVDRSGVDRHLAVLPVAAAGGRRMKQHKIDGGKPCPFCGILLDGATNIEGERGPQPGDFTICAYCGNVLVFADTDTTRRPEPWEEELALQDGRIQAAQAFVWDLLWKKEKQGG